MNGILLGTIAASAALAGYTCAGYPVLLRILGRRRKQSPSPPVEWPFISIVIPAYNEAPTIRETLDRLLASDYPADRKQILVVSDASTDQTDAIVREYASHGVELVRMETRGGKTRNENAALPFLRGSIVINTDATIRIHPGALKALVTALTDPLVGVASGRDVSIAPGSAEEKSGEGAYVGYEMWVRDLETAAGGIVGASGCLYAIRAELHRRHVREDLSRDFAAALTAREAGLQAVSVPNAICYVPRTHSLHQEYRRKVRTIARGLLTLWSRRHLLNPLRHGRFAWMLWSHKVCRWLMPWTAGFAVLALGALALSNEPARWLAAAVAGILALALAGWLWPEGKRVPKPVSLAAFMVAGNVAVVHAWLRALSGRRTPVWEPTRREGGRGKGEADKPLHGVPDPAH